MALGEGFRTLLMNDFVNGHFAAFLIKLSGFFMRSREVSWIMMSNAGC